MEIPLEDNFEDIIGKAQRGLALADSVVTERAGISATELHRLRGGHFDAGLLAKLAPVLGLNAASLSRLPKYRPAPVQLEGLRGFSTSFGDMMVNSYLAWDAATREAVAFDTGADSSPMLRWVDEKGLTLRLILLTHAHGDHVGDLDRLRNQTGAPGFIGRRERLSGVEWFDEGHEFRCGGLRIETRLTCGHSRGGTTYVIHGLKQPVAVVGDALFAGSMGGGMVSYTDALRTNREQILSLAPETLICPGHGPMTTVGEERVNNPFFG